MVPSKPKINTSSTEQDKEATCNMAVVMVVLAELKSLRSEFGGFRSKLDSIDDHLGKMASSVAALENNVRGEAECCFQYHMDGRG